MSLVSVFQNFTNIQENRPIEDVLHNIQAGVYRKEVGQVRALLHDGRVKEYEQAKRSLLAFTPSGRFQGGRRLEHLHTYSALVVLDLDKLPEEELRESRQAIVAAPYTYATFTSPSGNGLKVLVRIPGVAAEHKQAYSQVKEHYARLLGLRVDESGSDVTRLCFVSCDEELYLNSSSHIFPVKALAGTERIGKVPVDGTDQTTGKRIENSSSRLAANNHTPSLGALQADTDLLYRHCVSLTERKYDFIEGSRNSFVHQLACNLNRYGIQEADALSFLLIDFGYDAQEVAASVRSAYSTVQEHGTKQFKPSSNRVQTPKAADEAKLQAYTKQAVASAGAENPFTEWNMDEVGGADGKVQGDTNIDRIEEFLLSRYEFRHNSVTSRQEYRTSAKGKWRQLDDRAESTMLREMKKAQVRVSQSELRILLSSDFCPLYDPFKFYFKNLPAWDGETDFIRQLASSVTTTDPEQWQLCFRKWFVAMVAGVLDEKAVNHTLIVLSGGQGLGKTTWVLGLVPGQLKEYLYSGEINPGNKDALQQLSENMLINLDELENLNRSEIGALKEMVTKSEIKVRRAYGHHHEKMPRRASFAGSVNTAQFLNDTTGSRRFLCFEVTDIDYEHQVDLDMAYAQALHLYKNGFRFWFDKEEIKAITAGNERFQVLSVEEEMLLTWFMKPCENEPRQFLTASQIVAKLAEKTKISVTDASVNKIGKSLRKHGFTRIKRGGSYGYLVRELKWEEVERNNSLEPAAVPDTAPPF
ncbi:uncharacterized protein DUF3874 [Pontibacter ummariensis]|uniref:Virulence-associated protein E n=1 Tax=Pontibacter ummariensis TaxID=1610492 RepID=A0A239FXE1_9BACT|nr:VapE domain-containing protein [Pontibacter ummariensis]PRY11904.1 uncharacterized protein DUF3874 [Pontibacter ummariensis]SNS60892.1 protein of unknown function [Pontibacter ummariensis]